MLEMVIDSIRVSLMNYQRVVILKEKDSDRYLPIWVGQSEAESIAIKLQDVSLPRPLTHDLLDSVISSLGASVLHITVNDLQNDTFFAKVSIRVDGKSVDVDSRPSDAIALAVRQGYFLVDPNGDRRQFASIAEAEAFVAQQRKYHEDYSPEISKGCPIFADESVMDRAGIKLDESGKPIAPEDEDNKPQQLREEDLRRISAFTDFINTLDMEGIGKEGQQGSGPSS